MALSGIPCFLFFVKEVYSGGLEKLGFIYAFGPFVALYCLIANLATFSRVFRRDILQKYLYAPLTVIGAIGWLFPETTADDVGIKFLSAADKTMWTFLSRSILYTSVLFYTLVFGGGGVTEAIRDTTVASALTTLLDIAMVRKSTLEGAGFSFAKATKYTIFMLTMAALMFLLPDS